MVFGTLCFVQHSTALESRFDERFAALLVEVFPRFVEPLNQKLSTLGGRDFAFLLGNEPHLVLGFGVFLHSPLDGSADVRIGDFE